MPPWNARRNNAIPSSMRPVRTTIRQEILSLLRFDKPFFLEESALEIAARLSESAGTALMGKKLGQYTVLSLIGAGGMGEVYRASDSRLGRDGTG
jgi:eukaryotic-like serine/threonine-protein kinase